MSRAELIERKHQVIAHIQRSRRELEAVRVKDDRRNRRRIHELEQQLERLMAEEYSLRIAIDQAKHSG